MSRPALPPGVHAPGPKTRASRVATCRGASSRGTGVGRPPPLAPSSSDPVRRVRPSDPPTLRPFHPPTVRPSDRPTLPPSDRPTLRPSDPPTVRLSDPPTLRPSESDRPTACLTSPKAATPIARSTYRPIVLISTPHSVHLIHTSTWGYICDVGTPIARSYAIFTRYCVAPVVGLVWPSVSAGGGPERRTRMSRGRLAGMPDAELGAGVDRFRSAVSALLSLPYIRLRGAP
jgi:hypothetical protein